MANGKYIHNLLHEMAPDIQELRGLILSIKDAKTKERAREIINNIDNKCYEAMQKAVDDERR